MTTASLINILCVLLAHWLCDFCLQTDKQATLKSSSNIWLLAHVSVYTITMTCLLSIYAVSVLGRWAALISLAKFASITFVAHYCTDWVTSRINAKFWKEGKRHSFFMCIGFDQFLHYVQLLITLKVIFG